VEKDELPQTLQGSMYQKQETQVNPYPANAVSNLSKQLGPDEMPSYSVSYQDPSLHIALWL